MNACGDEDRTQVFRDALEALPEAIAVFDRNDCFVFWNRRFAEVYGKGVVLQAGIRFEDHLSACLAQRHVPAAQGREQEWLAERLARFAAAEGAHEHKLANGHWVRVQDRRLAHGGRIGIRADVTEAKEREQSFRLLFDANPIPMIVSDLHTHEILAVNDAAVAFYGHPRDAFLQLAARDIRSERASGELAAGGATVDEDPFASGLHVHRTASGEERLVQVTGCMLTYDGRSAILAALFDLTDQRRAEEEVRRVQAFLTEVVDQVPAAVFAKDMRDEGRYVVYNRACEALFGRSREDVVGRTDHEVFGADATVRYAEQDQVTLRLGVLETAEDEIIRHPDDSTRVFRTRKVALSRGRDDPPRFVLGVSEDVTERRASEARIAHMAHHDALTDLPNRFLFNDRLASAVARRREREMLAVLFLDLDNFKPVNDTYGHAVGDDLLRQVADRLRAAMRGCDTVARFGGDEFAILQSVITEAGEAAWLAARLNAMLAKPYRIDSHHLVVSASIGIALAPVDASEPGALLGRADAALYRAKREGRNTFRVAGGQLCGRGAHARDTAHA